MVGWGLFASKTIMLDIYIISDLNFPIPAWFVATMTISAYILALLAIDMVDNRIQLGFWQHPVQTQTLLLTRYLLASGSLKTIRRRRRVARKCTQKPIEKDTKETSAKDIRKSAKKQAAKDKIDPILTTPCQRKRTTSEPVTPEMLRRFLQEVPVEVSRSGTLIREARAEARRLSEAAALTPTRIARRSSVIVPETPVSIFPNRKYGVQSKVEVIERAEQAGLVGLERKVEGMERVVGEYPEDAT